MKIIKMSQSADKAGKGGAVSQTHRERQRETERGWGAGERERCRVYRAKAALERRGVETT